MVEESEARLVQYKPGNQNIIADALSRQFCHFTENEDSFSDSVHSSPSSPPMDFIRKVSFPINCYKNQFHIEKSCENELKTETVFPGYVLHKIKFSSDQDLIKYLKFSINEKTVNAIYTSEENFYHMNELLPVRFSHIKFAFTTKITRNIIDENEQEYLMITEHQRAHRNHKENYAQLKEKYFFPKMKDKIKTHVVNCEICKKQKFDTNPKKQVMEPTPIPTFVGEYIQIDVFHAGKRIYFSAIDRFSKFVYFRFSENKHNAHEIVEEILQLFPFCKYCMTDNESIFTSFPMKTLFQRKNII